MAHLDNPVSGQMWRIPLNPQTTTYVVSDGTRLTTAPKVSPEAIAAFYHSKHHFVLLALGRTAVFVNQCKVSMMKIIREGDHLDFGNQSAVFHELTTGVLAEGSELITTGRRCLVDRGLFKAGDSVVYCPSCHTPHHERCWRYQKGRCANGRLCDYQAPWDEMEPKTT
jgi:hypothetical protein